MMDEATAISLVTSLLSDISSIKNDTHDIKEFLIAPAESSLDADDENVLEPLLDDELATVELIEDAPALTQFEQDSLSLQSMILTVTIFILVALLLSIGVQLWLAFSDKWKG